MELYDELQLNQAGSKKLIKECTSIQNKLIHFAIYLFKILLTVTFCFVFVTVYSLVFANENSIVGVVVLLYLLVFRNANFTVRTNQSIMLFILFFSIMIVMPHLASHTSPLLGLLINGISISLFVILGCHEPRFYNQSTLVLSYLLLYGYPVSGTLYQKRVLGLIVGCALICLVFYFKNRHKDYPETIVSMLQAFNLKSSRSKWQLCQIGCVTLTLFVLESLGIHRAMWGAIAAMSIITPDLHLIKSRAIGRIVGNIAGILVFSLLYYTLPPSIYTYIGVLGGIGVGLSATYAFQAIFNTFGALAIATTSFGFYHALGLRLFTNVFAVLIALLFCFTFYTITKAQD